MISRVAESCFWLARYIERMDHTARMIDVNQAFMLDTQLSVHDAWLPLLVVAGEAPRFKGRFGEATDGERVQHYLTWDKENPVSILVSAHWARENARTIRESISREMWECLNRVWLWLDEGAGARVYGRDRSGFFDRIKDATQLFRGLTEDTMLHEEAYDFMTLGKHIERAGMTARILDVKHEMLALQGAGQSEAPRDHAQWHAILRSCSAIESFLKRGRSFRGEEIASFLVGDVAFPRAIRHCVREASRALDRIRAVPLAPGEKASGGSCAESLDLLEAFVVGTRTSGAPGELHEALSRVIEALARIGDELHGAFFAPLPETTAAESTTKQSQS